MKEIGIFLVSLFLLFGQAHANKEPAARYENNANPIEAQQIWAQVERQRGIIRLPNRMATLSIPADFVYIKPSDAEKVLVEIWGNIPGTGYRTLGMLLPANASPLDTDSWGVTIKYEHDGHVFDQDYDHIDYQVLLAQMQQKTERSNQERLAQGYEPMQLIGWAAEPFYDPEHHKLHWAKELKFGDETKHTLNYNIRVLGREGVLVLNFIADIEQKSLIDAKLDQVLEMAEFNPGSRYEDFNPNYDDVATYGIDTLITGKAAAQTGVFASIMEFLQKFGVVILLGVGTLTSKLVSQKQEA